MIVHEDDLFSEVIFVGFHAYLCCRSIECDSSNPPWSSAGQERCVGILGTRRRCGDDLLGVVHAEAPRPGTFLEVGIDDVPTGLDRLLDPHQRVHRVRRARHRM